jgi:zinc finger protein
MEDKIDVLEGQDCPICNKKTLTLREMEREIPFFGIVYLFSMTCTTCKYHKADVECANKKDPCKWEFEISSEEDMKVRIIKSGEATVKLPRIMTIESGPASNGYISNIEGLLNRVKKQLEVVRDESDDKNDRKKAKNLLKKVQNIMWGREKIKLTIIDPTGNSAIVSEKAVTSKIK